MNKQPTTASTGTAWRRAPSHFRLDHHASPYQCLEGGERDAGVGVEQFSSNTASLGETSDSGVSKPFSSNRALSGDRETSEAGGVSKPFRCCKCGMAYAHQGSLVRHRHKCEGTLVLTCMFCQHQFHRKDKLRQHFLNKHHYVDEILGPPGYTLMDPVPGNTNTP